ncbi:dehydrogenase/reductase SDR family member on chromosome X [Phyllostomus discolor]|uniref:Dehydrogenase/reductase SDR family member on chromosome X n=1 Tax=Phyllostomus discolor TaxID=89673 RepID=A0A7E6D4B5_9CHIR|nr:dehydrogenase/reductase SDR family member on chromosome X [Phyllostomus discolor]
MTPQQSRCDRSKDSVAAGSPGKLPPALEMCLVRSQARVPLRPRRGSDVVTHRASRYGLSLLSQTHRHSPGGTQEDLLRCHPVCACEGGNPAFLCLPVEFLYCDLASLESVREFVHKFKAKRIPLHVLVNNAGVMMVPQRKTADGFEEHFGVNYLGHFLLTNLLLDTLQESGCPGRSARVVTVSSATHYVGELDLDDLQSSRCYSPHAAYARSKLALVLFTYHLQRLLAAQGSHVTANAADPGVVDTGLYRHVFWGTRLVQRLFSRWLFKTPDEGAWTPVYTALAPALEGLGGRYLYNEKETASLAVTHDPDLQRGLWARSCVLTAVPDGTPDILAGRLPRREEVATLSPLSSGV